MAELKTKATAASVDGFLAQQEPDRLEDCRTIVRLMKAATGAKPKMWGPGIVGFGDYRYTNAEGKGTDWFETGFSPRKRDLTLYLMPGVGRYPELLEKLGKHSTGKSCLYIKRLADVDVDVLKALIESSVRTVRAMGK